MSKKHCKSSKKRAKKPRSPSCERGDQGECGDKGDVGPKGAEGKKGRVGEKGNPGETGPTGCQGAIGCQGPTGPKGHHGVKGDTGLQGDTGSDGSVGRVGPRGDTGSEGNDGSTGSVGATGSTGSVGVKGQDGSEIFGAYYYSSNNQTVEVSSEGDFTSGNVEFENTLYEAGNSGVTKMSNSSFEIVPGVYKVDYMVHGGCDGSFAKFVLADVTDSTFFVGSANMANRAEILSQVTGSCVISVASTIVIVLRNESGEVVEVSDNSEFSNTACIRFLRIRQY